MKITKYLKLKALFFPFSLLLRKNLTNATSAVKHLIEVPR